MFYRGYFRLFDSFVFTCYNSLSVGYVLMVTYVDLIVMICRLLRFICSFVLPVTTVYMIVKFNSNYSLYIFVLPVTPVMIVLFHRLLQFI